METAGKDQMSNYKCQNSIEWPILNVQNGEGRPENGNRKKLIVKPERKRESGIA